jgi:hypothetical protein
MSDVVGTPIKHIRYPLSDSLSDTGDEIIEADLADALDDKLCGQYSFRLGSGFALRVVLNYRQPNSPTLLEQFIKHKEESTKVLGNHINHGQRDFADKLDSTTADNLYASSPAYRLHAFLMWNTIETFRSHLDWELSMRKNKVHE